MGDAPNSRLGLLVWGQHYGAILRHTHGTGRLDVLDRQEASTGANLNARATIKTPFGEVTLSG